MEKCKELLENLISSPGAETFADDPINSIPSEKDRKAYTDLVGEPIYLYKIRDQLEMDYYPTPDVFYLDVKQCFENAKKFCRRRFPGVYQSAQDFQKLFRDDYLAAGFSLPGSKTTSNVVPALPKPAPQAPVPVASTKSTKRGAGAHKKNSIGFAQTSRTHETDHEDACGKLLSMLSTNFKFAYNALTPDPVPSVADYSLRIPNPLCFSEVFEKLEGKKYPSATAFAKDVRRVIANCLRYNYNPKLSSAIRSNTKQMLMKFESEFLKMFPNEQQTLPELKEVIKAIEDISKITVPPNNALLVFNFMDSVEAYWNGEYPDMYLKIVKKPMCLGTVLSNTIEGIYHTVDECKKDIMLIATNCETYYHKYAERKHVGVVEGELELINIAQMVVEKFMVALETELAKRTARMASMYEDDTVHVSSPPPTKEKKTKKTVEEKQVDPAVIAATQEAREAAKEQKKQEKAYQTACEKREALIVQMYQQKRAQVGRTWLLDRMKKIIPIIKKHTTQGLKKIKTCFPFLEDVNANWYPDYYDVIKKPISLATIQKKIQAGQYDTILDLIQDFRLLRSNAHQYNEGPANIDTRIMADTVVELAVGVIRRIVFEANDSGEELKIDAVNKDSIIPPAVCLDALYDFYNVETLLNSVEPMNITEFMTANPLPPSPQLPLVMMPELPPVDPGQYFKPRKQPGLEDYQADDGYVDDGAVDYGQSQAYSNDYGYFDGGSKQKIRKFKRDKEFDDINQIEAVYFEKPKLNKPMLGFDVSQIELRVDEQQLIHCLDRLEKHEWVRTEKVANFFRPVIELFPDIEEDYISCIEHPMDLFLVRKYLYEGHYQNPEEPVLHTIKVFQNAIDYNDRSINHEVDDPDDDVAKGIVEKCKHLLRYFQWIALELIDLDDDDIILNAKNRDFERQERWNVLERNNIQQFPGECNKVFKKLETNNRKEIEFFRYAVNTEYVRDYNQFVTNPIHYNLIREKYDNNQYTNYASFIDDLRLLFENGKLYNSVHKDVDPISLSVYDASCMFLEKLDNYVWKEFSINVCDKIAVHELTEIEKKRSYSRLGWEYVAQEPATKKKKGGAYADFSYEDGAELDDEDERRRGSYSDDDGDVYKVEHDDDDDDDDDERDDFDDGEEDLYEEEDENDQPYGRNPRNKGIGRGNAGPRGPGSRGGTSHLKKGGHVTSRGGEVGGVVYGQGFEQIEEEEVEDIGDEDYVEESNGVTGSNDDVNQSTSLSLSVSVALSDEVKEKTRRAEKQKRVKEFWDKYGKYGITQDTPIEPLLQEARERAGFVPKKERENQVMDIDENMNASNTDNASSVMPESRGTGISFNIVPTRKKFIKSSVLNIDDEEKLDDAFSKLANVVSIHTKSNASYKTKDEHTGITEFSHELSFHVPVGGVQNYDAAVGSINERGDEGYAPVVCSSDIYYGSKNEKKSYMVHLEIYLPCITQLDGDNFVVENDGAAVEVPVYTNVHNNSDKVSSTIDIEVDNWQIEFEIPSTSIASSIINDLNYLEVNMSKNISAIQHSVLYGQTELFPMSNLDGENNDDQIRYLLCSGTVSNSWKCDLIAVNEIYAGHNEHFGERKILEGMQIINKDALCSTHAKCVFATMHDEVTDKGPAKKGNFFVLNCLIPLIGEGRLNFRGNKGTKIWPVSEKKMKVVEISTKHKIGTHGVDSLDIACNY